jgi:hypothetical protein
LKAKDEAAFTDVNWSAKEGLSFKIKSSLPDSNKLTFRIPYYFNKKKIIDIKINGMKQNYFVRKVKGYDYAFISIYPGKTLVVAVKYSDSL